jgi:hypothetical protein
MSVSIAFPWTIVVETTEPLRHILLYRITGGLKTFCRSRSIVETMRLSRGP